MPDEGPLTPFPDHPELRLALDRKTDVVAGEPAEPEILDDDGVDRSHGQGPSQ